MNYIITIEIPTPVGVMPIYNTFEITAKSEFDAHLKARSKTSYMIHNVAEKEK